MQDTLVRSLGWEDPLEKEMATHSSILSWREPWTEEPGGLQSMGSQKVRHHWTTNTFTLRELWPLIDFPGGSDGKASAYSAGDPGSIPGLGRSPGEGNGNWLQYFAWKIPWTEEPGRLQSMGSQKESDTTEWLHFHFHGSSLNSVVGILKGDKRAKGAERTLEEIMAENLWSKNWQNWREK